MWPEAHKQKVTYVEKIALKSVINLCPGILFDNYAIVLAS